MKKILITLFALLTAVVVCACGGNTDKISENGTSSAMESLQNSEEIAQSEGEDSSLESEEQESFIESPSSEESEGEENSEEENVTSWVDIEFPRP